MNQVSIVSGNGLSPVRRQAITWTNADLLSIGLLEQISVKIESEFYRFHSRKCICKKLGCVISILITESYHAKEQHDAFKETGLG